MDISFLCFSIFSSQYSTEPVWFTIFKEFNSLLYDITTQVWYQCQVWYLCIFWNQTTKRNLFELNIDQHFNFKFALFLILLVQERCLLFLLEIHFMEKSSFDILLNIISCPTDERKSYWFKKKNIMVSKWRQGFQFWMNHPFNIKWNRNKNRMRASSRWL